MVSKSDMNPINIIDSTHIQCDVTSMCEQTPNCRVSLQVVERQCLCERHLARLSTENPQMQNMHKKLAGLWPAARLDTGSCLLRCLARKRAAFVHWAALFATALARILSARSDIG